MTKPSLYNHFQPWEGDSVLAYNAYAGTVAIMSKESYTMYKNLVDKFAGSTNPILDEDEKELLKQLKYGCFMRPDNFDEIETMRFRHNFSRYRQAYLGLTIAPAMACNMACTYCFEGNKRGRMSPEVADAVIQFVKARAGELEDLGNTWYGGEPLLAMDIIERLSEQFIELSIKNSFNYGSDMISNGVLLSARTVDRLINLNVRAVQVTLDGPARIHNEKRPLKNGQSSFERILENVQYAADKLMIGIRVNIDRNFSRDTIIELLQELIDAGIHEQVSVNFSPIFDSPSQVCSNISENCFDMAEFAAIETDYLRLLFDMGFSIGKVPTPSSIGCMAQSANSFLIDCDGDLYRCFLHPGDKSKSMGNIRDKINYQHPNFTRIFQFDPFEDQLCRQCNLLPLCVGGCPAFRVEKDLSGDEVCHTWRHNLQPMLEIIARAKMQKMQEAGKIPAKSTPA